jgi:hypothetical protein
MLRTRPFATAQLQFDKWFMDIYSNGAVLTLKPRAAERSSSQA